jgi:flagellar FliL protein
MAQNEEDLDLDVEPPKASGAGGMKKILLFSGIGVLLVALSVTTTLLLIGNKGTGPVADSVEKADDHGAQAVDKEKAADKTGHIGKSPVYLNLDPPFVVNLNDDSGVRFLQVAVSAMAYDPTALEKVEHNMPLVRHHLVLLFSSQKFADIKTPEGKEKLQAEALEVTRRALKDAIGQPLVEAIYLTSIVGQ